MYIYIHALIQSSNKKVKEAKSLRFEKKLACKQKVGERNVKRRNDVIIF